jgi:hypothetical protein
MHFRKFFFILMTGILVLLTSAITTVFADTPIVEDAQLEGIIKKDLNKMDEPLTTDDLAQLTKINAKGVDGISSLKGLEYATNLSYLNVPNGNITDLSPISHWNL